MVGNDDDEDDVYRWDDSDEALGPKGVLWEERWPPSEVVFVVGWSPNVEAVDRGVVDGGDKEVAHNNNHLVFLSFNCNNNDGNFTSTSKHSITPSEWEVDVVVEWW